MCVQRCSDSGDNIYHIIKKIYDAGLTVPLSVRLQELLDSASTRLNPSFSPQLQEAEQQIRMQKQLDEVPISGPSLPFIYVAEKP